MGKDEIRLVLRQIRGSLSPEVRLQKSAAICQLLENLDFFKSSKRILFYYGVQSEVDTKHLMARYIGLKKLYLPRLTGDTFVPKILISLDDLEMSRYKIPEPPGEMEDAEGLDLILIPGLGFDREGNRIGTGKGYYDRFLCRHPNVLRVGLAFSEQILDQVPKDPYDERVDWILTEKEAIRCKVSP